MWGEECIARCHRAGASLCAVLPSWVTLDMFLHPSVSQLMNDVLPLSQSYSEDLRKESFPSAGAWPFGIAE